MNELADIIDPAPPALAATVSNLWLVASALAFVLVVAFIVWWWRTAPHRRALRRVRQLHRDVARGALGARELAYHLAAELRAVLRTPRVHAGTAPQGATPEQERAWRDLVARLDALRYPAGAHVDAAQLDALLRDSMHWLKRVH